MSRILFITATDTGAGKTHISSGLLTVAAKRGLSTIGIKPVASGCTQEHGNIYNADALALLKASTHKLPYDLINTYRFLPAIAPHIAAHECATHLSVASLIHSTQPALDTRADLHVIEGFGGWHAPLNNNETMADYAVQINCEIILVVGMRLGCLNHAILTEKAIAASGGHCIGWIANVIDPDMSHCNENIESLCETLNSDLLGIVPFGVSADHALHQVRIF
jgi:dethiobiotin synthetase